MRRPSNLATICVCAGLLGSLALVSSARADISYRTATTAAGNAGAASAVPIATATDAANGTVTTLTLPGASTTDDVLIVVVAVENETTASVTAPAGFTQIRGDDAADHTQIAYYRVVTASDVPGTTSWSWSWASARDYSAALLVFRNIDPGSPIDTHAGGADTVPASSTTVDIPAVTPSARNAVLVLAASTRSGPTFGGWADGMAGSPTERTDARSGAGGDEVGLGTATRLGQATVNTSTGAMTVTASIADNSRIGQLIALAPRGAVLTMPPGTGEGDLMIAVIAVEGQAHTTVTSGGNAFTKIRGDDAADHTQAIYYRFATATDVSNASTRWGWSWGTNRDYSAALLVIRGVSTTAPIDAQAGLIGAGTSTTIDIPAVTPTADNTFIVSAGSSRGTGGSVSGWSGTLTGRTDATSGAGGGSEVSLGTATAPGPTAGVSTGAQTVTGPNDNSRIGQTIALTPATVPGPVLRWKMDESSWNGTAGEVVDASGNGLNGTAFNSATTTATNAKFCRSGSFDGVNQYVQIADTALLDITDRLTVTAWIRPTAYGGGGTLKTIASKDENYEFHVTSAGTIFWWWTAGANAITTTGTAPLNVWTHVAIVFTRGAQEVFINGVRDADNWSNPDRNLLTVNADPFQVAQDQGFAGRYFNGLIDEVRIYNYAMSDADVLNVYNEVPTCPAIDHIRVEHDGIGLTCTPETVTVKACVDASCSSLYSGTVTTTLSPTGWVGGDTISFTGSTTADLRVTVAGTVTLGAGSTSPAPTNPTRCFVGASETCSLEFKTSGFIFDVPDLTACKTSASVTMTAVRTDDTSQKCVPAFESGTRTVNFWSTYSSPATGTQQVEVNGTPVATSSPGTGISLTFAAGATTSFTVRYPDAGQMLLNARYTGSGSETGLVMDGSDTFVSVPVGLAVVPSGGACVAGDATCAAYKKAGESFNHNVKAACWTADGDTDLSDNPATPNFQMANIPLTSNLIAPGGGTNATLGATTVTFGSGDGGDKTVSQTVSEVGVFTITATPPALGYFGLTVPGGTSPNIGRFYPDHFTVTSVGVLAPACTGGSTDFSYLGQPFDITGVAIEARNAGNAKTNNYTGAFAKHTPGTFASWGFGARDTAGAGTALTSRINNPSALPTISGSWSAGALSSNITSLVIDRIASPDGPFTSAKIGIAPTDSDGVALVSGALDLDVDGAGGNDHQQIGSTTVLRFGRLRMQNALGPANVALPVPIETQYWNGATNVFVRNADDSCTTIPGANIGLSDYRLNLNAGETSVVQATVSFASGVGTLSLSAPGVANNGSVLVTPDLVAASREYLQGAWTGSTWDQNPSARATFGLYGSQPQNFIFFRENY